VTPQSHSSTPAHEGDETDTADETTLLLDKASTPGCSDQQSPHLFRRSARATESECVYERQPPMLAMPESSTESSTESGPERQILNQGLVIEWLLQQDEDTSRPGQPRIEETDGESARSQEISINGRRSQEEIEAEWWIQEIDDGLDMESLKNLATSVVLASGFILVCSCCLYCEGHQYYG
jgi:hypothetical protein